MYDWIEKFNSSRTSVTHEEVAVQPSTSITDEQIQQGRDMVMAKHRTTNDDVACCLQIQITAFMFLLSKEFYFDKTKYML